MQQFGSVSGTDIRIGTCGWSYPSGAGSWAGLFYPPTGRGRRPAGFDELAYYGEHFDTVEVNSTFYGVPRPEVTAAWARRTPPAFEFSLKLFQKFTHPEMFKAAARTNDAAVGRADVDQFREAVDPLASAGKLGALLAQFPPSFKNEPRSRDHLAWLLDSLGTYPVAVELRHRSWSDDVRSTVTLLNGMGAAWVQIDEPKCRFSIAQNYLPNVTSFYYMRLHGRNAAKWWRHERAEERYDYLYSSAELKPFAETANAASRIVRKLYLYLNNHFSAKAVANAASLKHQLGMDVAGTYRPELVARYPELKDIVATSETTGALLPLAPR